MENDSGTCDDIKATKMRFKHYHHEEVERERRDIRDHHFLTDWSSGGTPADPFGLQLLIILALRPHRAFSEGYLLSIRLAPAY